MDKRQCPRVNSPEVDCLIALQRQARNNFQREKSPLTMKCKKSTTPAIVTPQGYVYTGRDKADTIADSLEKQFSSSEDVQDKQFSQTVNNYIKKYLKLKETLEYDLIALRMIKNN
ncbi:hypothetical protein PR048_009186 [Dryococelus australis]|uniref:Uncharacterized protein n=1 Tax=Dryococelus australis TaxID=614101 RepID=A0ABQ9HZ63_9NEOP|nr:hypothetical protein PR048_009186 [Dryococelus australis]